MECPVCSEVLPDGSAACPKCKADLSKWHPKKAPAKPAVILEQRDVVTLSAQVKPLAPFVRPLIILAIFCAVVYAGYKIYFAYVMRTATENSAVESPGPADAGATPAPATTTEVVVSTGG